MIEVEVKNAMKKKEHALDALIETIQQQLDHGMSSEASVKLLQVKMNLVADRAEKALTHLNETPSPSFPSSSSLLPSQTPPVVDSTEPQSQLEGKNIRTLGESLEGSSVSEFMENTKKQFERLHAENAALKAAFEDIQRERATPSPTVRRTSGQVMEGLAKLMHIKREPTDPPDDMSPTATVSVKRTNEELMPPEGDRNIKRIKQEPMEPHPPLPQLPVPMCPPAEAAQYNLPPRLKIELAHIRNPSPQISVMWKWGEWEAKSPPMSTVKVFFTTEPYLGCGYFEPWQEAAEVEVSEMPMTMISHYRAGHKICVTVVCKDMFDRYGPFSKVECAYM